MPYKYNPFINNFDDSTTGPTGTVSAAGNGTAALPGIAFASDTSTGIYRPGASQLGISTGGTLRLLVDASGNVSIGTTVSSGKIQLPRGGFIGFSNAADNANSEYIYANAGNLEFGINGATRFNITSTGLVGIGLTPTYQLQLSTDSAGKPSTNTWTIVSDERIKEDIELADLDLCYEAIKTIPLKRYKWRDDVYSNEQVTDRRKLGWIAQDVEAVFPKAVSIHEFKYNQVYETVIVPEVPEELDDEGNVIKKAVPEYTQQGDLISEETIPDCKDLNADQIYAAMYGAIQKLIIKFEAFEKRLDDAGIK
jgi:hypothetical protein